MITKKSTELMTTRYANKDNLMTIVNKVCSVSLMLLVLLINTGCNPTDAHSATMMDCDDTNSMDCVYASDLNYPVVTIRDVSLIDYARNNYEVKLVVRYPEGAPGPLPVVFWNHGGRPSAQAGERSENWSNKLASAGYVVIHPVREFLTDVTAHLSECQENGFNTPDECNYWVTQFRYGPQNIRFLIENLREIETTVPAIAGLLDSERIVVAGHSSGSSTVIAAAGAWQQWSPTAPRYMERVDQPIAFLASGVQGPMYAGFNSGFHSPGEYGSINEHSFKNMERPFMFITGVGDETGEPPEARTTGWLTSVPGNKVLLWDTNAEAVHETMNAQKCDTVTRQYHCEWIKSAGLAFLDAVVRQRPEAIAWIKSSNLHDISGGQIEMHRR